MATYPTGIYAPALIVDGSNYPLAIDVNLQNNEIVAIQTELGLAPSGSSTDLVTRLNMTTSGSGNLTFTDSSTLTISGGVVTVTRNLHKVDTQSAAASDDLDTITAAADGYVLILSPATAARVVTVKHNTGNIQVVDGRDIVMASNNDMVLLVYSTALVGWRAFYTGKRKALIDTISSTGSATAAQEYLMIDCTSGSVTMNLPAATASEGVVLTFKKVDVSANTVIIDGNASETIDGATTKVLSAQYASTTIVCDGSAWYIT